MMYTVEGIALIIGVLGTAIASSAAYRVLGRIEGTVERYGARLQDHSDKIEAHDAILVQLLGLPEDVKEMRREIHLIKGDVESISDRLKRNGNDNGNSKRDVK